MTSRELVKTSLAFAGPERIPMGLPAPYPNDFVRGGGPSSDPERRSTGWYKIENGWEMIDEWGNTWQRLEDVSKGEVVAGAITDWADLEEYEFPCYDRPGQYTAMRARFEAKPDKYRIASLPGFPFNVARYMRRLDHFLEDVLLQPERVTYLLNRVADVLADMIEHSAGAGADAVMFAEDWGTQDRLMISPQLWRAMFRPGFERLCGLAHEHGLAVFMHCCGHVYEIIPDLIAVGIDVLQFDQPALHGIDNLARDFGGKVHFWCPVDIQTTLQTQDPEKIWADARRMIRELGGFGGGFIAGYYGSNEAIRLDPKVQDIACRAFVEYGTYRGSDRPR